MTNRVFTRFSHEHSPARTSRCLAYVDPAGCWPGLRSIVQIESTRRVGDAVTTELRYYLTSLPADAAHLAGVIRSHWSSENCLHWALDVAFREDRCRIRDGHAPENLAILRHFALNLLRQYRSVRGSIAIKRTRAALIESYFHSLLARMSA